MHGCVIGVLPHASNEPGNVSNIPREDEGADGGAHAED